MIAGLFIATTQVYPPPSCDETSYGSAAFEMLQTGRVNWASILPEGDPTGWNRDQNIAAFGRIYIAGLRTMFMLFGPSLSVARLFSLLGWVLAAGLTYQLGQQLHSQAVGIGAALLFATTTKAFFTAHFARPETWLAAATLAAVLMTLYLLRSGRPHGRIAFLAGAVAVLPGYIHGNGFAFTAAIGILVGVVLGQRRQWRALLAFSAAGLLAGLAWPILHFEGSLDALPYALRYIVLTNSPDSIGPIANLRTMGEWFRLVFWVAGGPISLLELGLALLGLGLAWRTKTRRQVALLALPALLIFGLVFSQRFVQYSIVWSPYWIVLGVAGLADVSHWSTNRWPNHTRLTKLALPIAIGGILAIQTSGLLWLSYNYQGGQYNETGTALAEMIPDNSRVIADMTWWWWLNDNRVFMDDEEYFHTLSQTTSPAVRDYLNLSESVSPSEAVPRLFQRLKPDFVVIDSALGCKMSTDANWDAMVAYVQSNCIRVGEVAGNWVGDSGRRTSQFGQISTVYDCTSSK